METEKLFYKDVELKTFKGKVLSCKENENVFDIILDRTIFYPEGGGQNSDRGVIDNSRVLDVKEENGSIIHIVDKAIPVGKEITGSIDWPYRFQMMQKHTAEHILISLLHKKFGYKNVGFHMGDDYTTLDINGVVEKDILKEIEKEANRIIYKNKEVKGYFPSPEELKNLKYRGDEGELKGKIRIVSIDGVDNCACCGLHTKTTGQSGLIKIIDAKNYKQGMRITMLCGLDAFNDYSNKHEDIEELSTFLSAEPEKVLESVEGLQEEIVKQKDEIVSLTNSLLDYIAKEVETGDYTLLFQDLEGEDSRRLANRLVEKVGIAFIFSKDDKKESMYRYCIASDNDLYNMREYAKKINENLNGRGGGSEKMAQGSVETTKIKIKEYIESMVK